jgi:hypothetical protein
MSRRHDNTPYTAPTLEQRARRRVAIKTGFFIHLLVFVLVNAGLYGLAAISGFGDGWGPRHAHGAGAVLWGWGLGLAIHGIVVFSRLQGEGLKQRMVDNEIAVLRRREGADSR